MTTATRAPATSAPPPLDLDTRLALRGTLMDHQLAVAAVAFEVNIAHIAGADPIPDMPGTLPLTRTLAPAANPYTTPLAGLLHRARTRLETHGWLRGRLRDDQAQARCLIGAIRIEADSRWQADDACALLLDTIQRTFAVDTIQEWNDAQTSPAPVLLMLDRAAQLAADRGL